MAKKWYYGRNGSKVGPVTSGELRALASSGKLRPTDKVWVEGHEQPKEAKLVKGLFASHRPEDATDGGGIADLDMDSLRGRLTCHADAVPHHGIADLGSKIELRSARSTPVHRIAWTTLFEGRRVVERLAPHDGGRDVPSPKVVLQNLDAWAITLPPPTEFQDGSSEHPVEGSESIHRCDDCRSLGHVECDGCQGQKVVACGSCGGVGLVRCDSCSGTGRTYQMRSEQRARACRLAGRLPALDGSGTCRGGWDGRGRACPRCNGTGTEYYIHQERYPVPCMTCSGQAKHACPTCGGGRVVGCPKCSVQGRIACPICQGHRRVVRSLAVVRSHEIKEKITLASGDDCPEATILGLDASRDFRETLSRSWFDSAVVLSFGPKLRALDGPVQALRDEVQAQGGADHRRVGDRLLVSEARVIRLDYSYEGEEYTAWFSGDDGPVHAPTSPVVDVAVRRIKEALAAWTEGRPKDAVRALRQAVAMAKRSPECRAVLEGRSPDIPEELMTQASAFSIAGLLDDFVVMFRRRWAQNSPSRKPDKPASADDDFPATRRRLWERAWLILPCLFVCFPLGLPLVWMNRSWSRRTKTFWSIGGAVFFAVVLSNSKEDRGTADIGTTVTRQASTTSPATPVGVASPPGNVPGSASGVRITHSPYTQIVMPTVEPSKVHPAERSPEPDDEGPAVADFTGHADRINAVALNGTGTIVASGDESGVVKLWRLPGGEEIAGRKASKDGRMSALALSPKGDVLFTGAESNQLWRVEGFAPIRTLTGGEGAKVDASFSPDGRTVAAVVMTQFGYESSVRFWGLDMDREGSDLPENGTTLRIAFSPDGSLLACGLREGRVTLWDWEGRKMIRSIDAHAKPVSDVAFSPDGRRLASVADDGSCKIWDVQTGRSLRTIEGGGRLIFTAFVPDGESLVAVKHNSGDLTIWHVDSGRLKSSGRIFPGLLFSQDEIAASGGMIVAGGYHDPNLVRAVKIDEIRPREETRPVSIPDLAQVDFASGPDGEPIELERSRPGDGFAPFHSYFYRDRHGRIVRHGPYIQLGGDGRKMNETVYIHGTSKFGQAWDSEGRLIRAEVYKGDEDHVRVDHRYWDDGGIKSISRFLVRHIISEAGERIEAIPHGLSLTYYDNTLVRSRGLMEQIAGLHQAERYENGELVGIAVLNRDGVTVSSRGRIDEAIGRLPR